MTSAHPMRSPADALGTQWQDGTSDRDVRKGDLVRAFLRVRARRPAGVSTSEWAEGIGTGRVTGLWNEALAARGLSTRFEVLAYRPSSYGLNSLESMDVTFELVARCTANIPLVALVLIALLVDALTRAVLNGAGIISVEPSGVATILGTTTGAVLKAVPWYVYVLGAAGVGAVLLWR